MALGRGLSELLGEVETAYENSVTTSTDGVTELDVAHIKANPNQPRKIFDETKLLKYAMRLKLLMYNLK